MDSLGQELVAPQLPTGARSVLTPVRPDPRPISWHPQGVGEDRNTETKRRAELQTHCPAGSAQGRPETSQSEDHYGHIAKWIKEI